MTKENKDTPMTPEERKQAEKTMSSALDMLRKERGQLTIEEEESTYQDDPRFQEPDEDDFTTSSLTHSDPNLSLVHDLLQEMSTEEKPLFNASQEAMPKKSEQKKQPKKEVKTEKQQEKRTDKKPKEKKPKEKKHLSKVTKIVICVIFAGLVALAGYTYKVVVYDPANIVSKAQQKAYDKLVAYADEYGDNMMSDAEKLELLDLQDEYKSLLDKQKEEINAYFKEQTGKTYKGVLKDVKALEESKEEAQYPAYQSLSDFLNAWESKSDDEKLEVLNLQDGYNGLPSNLKNKIDALALEKTGKSFTDVCNEQSTLKSQKEQEAQKAEQEATSSQNETRIASLQSSLNSLQSELNTYIEYRSSLNEDLAQAQTEGLDTSSIQTQIQTNEEMIASLQSQIAYYQSQIAALQ